MRGFSLTLSSVAFAIALSPSAHAAELVYSFSGTINNEFQFSPAIPEWQFSVGKTFSGTLTIDTALINASQPVVTNPLYSFTRYYGAITSLSYSIETNTGTYAYSPPASGSSYAVGAGSEPFAFNGVDLRWENFPAAFSGTPQIAVPDAAKIGNYTPHATFLTLGSFVKPDLLASTDPNVDLASLHSQLTLPVGFGDSRDFTVRFSDPALWPPGQERLDAIVSGNITAFSLVTGGVPEPATWSMMIVAFAFVGSRMRKSRSAQRLLAV